MQAMKCEICGSNEIIKQEGIYVCQHCGTKYSVEDAKKLIGVVKIDKSEELEKTLVLAQRARKNGDTESAIRYYTTIMENDPDNWEAIFYLNYFRLESDHAQTDTLGRSLDDVLRLVKQNEPEEKQITILKEIKEKVENISGLIHSEKIRFLVDGILDNDSSKTQAGGYGRVCLLKLANAIENNYPEQSDFAAELRKKAKEQEDEEERQTDLAYAQRRKWASEDREHEYAAQKRAAGGCYIATCVYGSYDCPQVWTLRRFRDNTLASTWYGRMFIRIYYAISPKLVSMFGKTIWFKQFWQHKLDRLVSKLQNEGVADTPYSDK